MTRDERSGQTRGGTGPRRETISRKRAEMVETPTAETGDGRQRIAKLMARAGLCSRRDAESWIVDGRVSVNDVVLTSPALDVGPSDVVLVDGEPLPTADKTRLFLFHKPGGLITSDHDPEGRETVFDYLREHWPDGPRVVTIGRLDFNTEGLLLLTNDGGLARILELPKTGWVRRYRVRAKGTTDQGVLDRLAHGVTIEGIEYAGIEAKLDRIQGANCWLTMGLREGKNREVKRVLEHIGLDVNRLIRLSFGPFQLLDLPEGHVEEVKTRILRDQLGPSLAAAAGVDFEEPEAVAPIVAAPERTPLKLSARAGGPTRAPRTSETKAAPRGRSSRDRAPESEPAAEPEIRERPIAGPRKHVSTLRAQKGTESRTGPRTRLERSDTTDRKNRTVTVERRVSTEPTVDARARPARRAREDQPPRRERSDSPARRERSESPARRERPESPARRERSESPARRERPESSLRRERSESPARRERPESPARRERSESSAPSRGERSAYSPRREQTETSSRGERSTGPKRSFAAEAQPSQSALGKRERVARSGGTTSEARTSRSERSFSANRQARADERASRPPRRDASETPRPRAPRAASGKTFGGDRPTGGRPATGRVTNRGSDKPTRSRPARDKPTGERTSERPTRTKSFSDRPARGRSAEGDKRPSRPERPAGRSADKPSRSPRGPSGDRPRPPRKPRG